MSVNLHQCTVNTIPITTAILLIVNAVFPLSFNTKYRLVAESDVAEFTFLSSVNVSKIHQNEYHIIKVNIPSKQATYVMHLSKSDDLFIPEHLNIEKEQVEHYECLYTGTISSSDGQHVGRASLSSCLHETAFEGLMSLHNEHYQITPSLSLSLGHRYRRFLDKGERKNSKVIVGHKISKPKTSPKRRRSDSKRVPKAELKKARKQMIEDQKSLPDEKDEEDNSNFGKSDDTINVEMMSEMDSDASHFNGYDNTLEEPLFVANTRAQTKPIVAKKNKIERVIELGIFTDAWFYNQFKEKYPQDTGKKINQYILALVNNMNYLYQQPEMGPKISFRLVNLGIQKDIPDGLKPSTTAENYLDSFCVFAGKKDKGGAIWDHAMMITGLELTDQSGNDNLGIAFTSTMCLRYWSCSLVEYNKGFETLYTAAHELGHSLGMEHDGDMMNIKCDPSKFIMAANSGTGQINWSPCSNQNINNFLLSGDPRANVKDPSNVPKCLTKRGSRKKSIRYKTGQFPGKVFDAAKQCQQVCEGCIPYIAYMQPYNNICDTLYCQELSSKEIFVAHPALEGTACGQEKMCRNGKCQ